MRKLLISILLATVAASPAIARPQQDDGDTKNPPAHQSHQQAHDEGRGNRGGENRPQFQMRQQVEVQRNTNRGGWDRGRFEGRVPAQPVQVQEQAYGQRDHSPVLRFVNRLGFRGYPEFQKALRDELDERNTSPLTAYAAGAPAVDGPLDRAQQLLPKAVEATLAELPAAEVDACIQLLADAHLRVTAYGGRFSSLLAQYLVLHLVQIRGGSRMLPGGPVERAAALADLGRKDLLVVFDYRRYEPPTLALAQAAKAADVKIVLFTDRWLSPIAGIADVVLPTRVDSPSPYDSFVPSLAVIEAVIDGVITRLGPAVGRRLAAIEQAAQRHDLL